MHASRSPHSLRVVAVTIFVIASALLLGPLGARPASAQPASGAPADSQGVARDLMKRGQEAARNGNWQEAYDAFRAAWGLVQDHTVACNLAQATIHLDRSVEGAERARDCVRLLPATAKPEHRRRVDEGYEKARALVAALKLDVSPEGSDILLDGKSLGSAPITDEVFVEPGTHTIEASHPAHDPAKRAVLTKKGEVTAVTLNLSARSSSPSAGPPPATPDPGLQPPAHDPAPHADTQGISTRTVALIATGGLAAISLGVAIVFNLKGSAADDDAATLRSEVEQRHGPAGCSANGGAGSSLCQDLQSANEGRADANRIFNIALPVTGIFAAGFAATLLFWPPADDRRTSTPHLRPTLSATPSDVRLTYRINF